MTNCMPKFKMIILLEKLLKFCIYLTLIPILNILKAQMLTVENQFAVELMTDFLKDLKTLLQNTDIQIVMLLVLFSNQLSNISRVSPKKKSLI